MEANTSIRENPLAKPSYKRDYVRSRRTQHLTSEHRCLAVTRVHRPGRPLPKEGIVYPSTEGVGFFTWGSHEVTGANIRPRSSGLV